MYATLNPICAKSLAETITLEFGKRMGRVGVLTMYRPLFIIKEVLYDQFFPCWKSTEELSR